MEQVRKPLQIISISFAKGFAYIKSVRVSIFSVILQICLLNFLWQMVYWNKESIDGISLVQMKSYLVLSQAISLQFGALGVDDKIASDFYNGNIVFDLLKPVRYLPYLMYYKLGNALFVAVLKWPFIFLASFLLFGFTLPVSPLSFLLFLASLATGFVLLFYIEFLIGLLCFYTKNKYGIRTLKQALLSFLSGTLVPLYFLPDWMQRIVNILPFQYLISFPASIYTGILSPEELFPKFALQLLWIILLSLLAHALYRFSIQKIIIQGG